MFLIGRNYDAERIAVKSARLIYIDYKGVFKYPRVAVGTIGCGERYEGEIAPPVRDIKYKYLNVSSRTDWS